MRLIDADALLDKMSTRCDICQYNDHRHVCRHECEWHEAMDEVEDMDEVQTEDVVRCKDCKYAHLTYDGDCKYCQLDIDRGYTDATYRDGNWFCADGERREDDEISS